MSEKNWSINVFAKDEFGNYTKDMYNLKYKWSYDNLEEAQKAFSKIPFSEEKETCCELIEFDCSSRELSCIETKFSNHFAGPHIIPGKYLPEVM